MTMRKLILSVKYMCTAQLRSICFFGVISSETSWVIAEFTNSSNFLLNLAAYHERICHVKRMKPGFDPGFSKLSCIAM